MLDTNANARANVITMPKSFEAGMASRLGGAIGGAIRAALCISELDQKYREVTREADLGPLEFCQKALEVLDITYSASEIDRAKVPTSGPTVVVSNHPFGMLDGIVLIHLLNSIRPDVKVLANGMLSGIKELEGALIPVDPFGTKDAVRGNYKGIKSAMSWLKSGGMLATFPSGEVSHVDFRQKAVMDPQWNPSTAGIIRRTGAAVLPVYFFGTNDIWFQLMGLIHPRLRTAMLPMQLLNKRKSCVTVAVGKPISNERLACIGDDREMVAYIRQRTYMLGSRNVEPTRKPAKFISLGPVLINKRSAKIDPPQDVAAMSKVIASLPVERRLASKGPLDVYCTRAWEMDCLLKEIGRLREYSFRAVGEGTGKPSDLDRFDLHYQHLFIWNREASEIVGAYRIGATDEILPKYGPRGLYTSELFKFKNNIIDTLSPALELGRSFVRPEYQKQYAPLLLLWTGIGQLVASRPRYRHLFGPVSISNHYGEGSRRMMVSYLKEACSEPTLSPFVAPRRPFKQGGKFGDNALASSVDELSQLVSDMEADGKDVPILVKHYLRLGAKVLGFNVDKSFANALDGLVLVDLTKTPQKVLSKYMGETRALAYLDFHRAGSARTAV